MKKLLNTRYPFLIMIGVAAGIVTAVSCIYGKFFQAVLVVAAFALTTLLFCVKSKKLPIIIFAAISCVLGVASTLLFSFSLDRERIYCDEKVVVTGYVSYNPEGEDSDYFVLRRPTVTFPDGTERKLRYDVSARLFYK